MDGLSLQQYIKEHRIQDMVSNLIEGILIEKPTNPKKYWLQMLENSDETFATEYGKGRAAVEMDGDVLKGLLEATRRINKEIVPKETINAIIREALRLTRSDRASLFIYNPHTKMLTLTASNLAKPIRVHPKQGIAGHVFASKETVNIADCYKDTRFDSDFDKKTGYRTRQLLAVPVVDFNGEAVGVLQIMNKANDDDLEPFTSSDQLVAEHLAQQAGIALRNAELYGLAVKSLEKSEGLVRILSGLSQDLGAQSTILTIAMHANELVSADRSTVYLVDHNKEQLWSIATDSMKEIRISWNKGKERKTINILDAWEDERFNSEMDVKTGYRTRSVLVCPIQKDGQVYGVIQMINKCELDGEVGIFDDDDEDVIETFAGFVGQKLASSSLFKRVEKVSEAGKIFGSSTTQIKAEQPIHFCIHLKVFIITVPGLVCGLVLLAEVVCGEPLVDPPPCDDTSTSPCSQVRGLPPYKAPIHIEDEAGQSTVGALRGTDLAVGAAGLWEHGMQSSLISTDSLLMSALVGEQPVANGTQPVIPALTSDSDDEGRRTAQPWPIYGAMLAVLVAAVVAFEYLHLRWSETNFDEELTTPQENTQGGSTSPLELGKMLALIKPYFSGRTGKKSSWRYAFVLTLLSLCNVGLSYLVNDITARYWNCIQAKDFDNFLLNIFNFIFCVLGDILLTAYGMYLRSMFLLEWRAHHTDRLQRMWLKDSAHYRMQLVGLEGSTTKATTLDNPDQRIANDVNVFTDASWSLVSGMMLSGGTLLVFLPLLFRLSPQDAFGVHGLRMPGWLLYTSLVYCLLGSLGTHLVGQQLIVLDYAAQRVEADFRSDLIRIRDHGENVAMLHAQGNRLYLENLQRLLGRELSRLERSFMNIKRITYESMFVTKRLKLFDSFFEYTGNIFPLFVLSGAYFSSQITLGHLNQTVHALRYVLEALRWFVQSYGIIIKWRAAGNRLFEFESALNLLSKTRSGLKPVAGDDDSLTLDSCDIYTPTESKGLFFLPGKKEDDLALLTKVNFKLGKGQWALLSGPEGSGKTSLLRALAGVWPFVGPRSRLSMPPKDKSLFLPSRKAPLRDGSLREAVCYPDDPEAYSDRQIECVLHLVGLTHLLSTSFAPPTPLELPLFGESPKFQQATLLPPHPLDRREHWSMILSAGEAQRLEIAHALLSKPEWLFLDESTSNLAADQHAELYKTLRKNLPPTTGVLSVSHNTEKLNDVHDVHYVVKEGEGWDTGALELLLLN
ncbi:ATP-binding cassette sub- D member 4 [Perkinsus chesapeaki]|uniref:ATP-binding cassette sub- D member 4 n=1 Tax=Perkinsus chesapeaki TaxID=330153 RepID=A0A7J6N1E8_PERCH|nr:ATP-binding cassette sub- D member 4 [Perkinsus chesapeaki]